MSGGMVEREHWEKWEHQGEPPALGPGLDISSVASAAF